MAKWYGKIGFATNIESEPGIWTDDIVERSYYGDTISNRWRRDSSGNVNDDINLSLEISIVADQYAINHCSDMIYVENMGTLWKVNSIDPQHPRLILSIGGVYNGQTAYRTSR